MFLAGVNPVPGACGEKTRLRPFFRAVPFPITSRGETLTFICKCLHFATCHWLPPRLNCFASPARRPSLRYPRLRGVRFGDDALIEGVETHRIEGDTARV